MSFIDVLQIVLNIHSRLSFTTSYRFLSLIITPYHLISKDGTSHHVSGLFRLNAGVQRWHQACE
jgi:hypothetical protein